MSDGPHSGHGAVSGQGDAGQNWRKSGPGWGDDYGKQAASGVMGLDKEIDNVSCLQRGRLGRKG
jgi:ribosomal protein L15